MARTGLPGVILLQSHSLLREHGTAYPQSILPSNVKEVIDEGTDDSFIANIAKARIIVIPRFKWDINASGISTYLMSMALGKCVIISHGPGTSDILRNREAILVPPEDEEALARAIDDAWRQDELRAEISSNGHEYAKALGDESRLLTDILCESIRLCSVVDSTDRSLYNS